MLLKKNQVDKTSNMATLDKEIQSLSCGHIAKCPSSDPVMRYKVGKLTGIELESFYPYSNKVFIEKK